MAKRILIVDDSEDTRRIFSDALTAEGYEVILATDGDEALRMVGWARPDLILLDVMMPGVDGLTVCRTFKQNAFYRPIPILLISARFSDPVFREQAADAGAEEIITKPIMPPELLAKVRNHLGKTHSV